MGFSTILLIMFAVMFWIFRIITAIVTQLGVDFLGIVSWNLTYEIVLIFVTIISLILIGKKKVLGSIIYLISYLYYFGTDLVNRIGDLTGTMSLDSTINVIIAFIGIILPISIFLDTIMLKAKKGKTKKQKTDWFYGNKEFDRRLDERADRNEYKF